MELNPYRASVAYLRRHGFADAADQLEQATSGNLPPLYVLSGDVEQNTEDGYVAIRFQRDARPFKYVLATDEAESFLAGPSVFASVMETAGGPDKVFSQGSGVVMPNHYGRHELEPIRFSVANYGPGYLIGNILKYISRYDAKDGHKDLAKAARYVELLRRYEAGIEGWWEAHDGSPLPDTPEAPMHGKRNG